MTTASFHLTLLSGLLILVVSGKPHPETLSRHDAEHFGGDPDKHNFEFDHNAFLGEEQAKEFAKFSPAQNEVKLNEPELNDWIKFVAETNVQTNVDRQWSESNPTDQDLLDWEEYSTRLYGSDEDRRRDIDSYESYKDALKHDKRRWTAADLDKNGKLSKVEFVGFVHPEEKPYMRDVMIDELLEAVDTDKDGYISEDEYLADISRAYKSTLKAGETEPDWVEQERSQFHRYRDVNHDGRMDRMETGEWIMPAMYDPIDSETKHLLYHADLDKDGRLTESEIMEKRNIFISSQATNYGNFNNHLDL